MTGERHGHMDFSLPAWIGALIGTMIAVAIYAPGIAYSNGSSARRAVR